MAMLCLTLDSFVGSIFGLFEINLSIRSNFLALSSFFESVIFSGTFSIFSSSSRLIGVKLVNFNHSLKECTSLLSNCKGLPRFKISKGDSSIVVDSSTIASSMVSSLSSSKFAIFEGSTFG